MFKMLLRLKVFWLIYRDPRTPLWAKVVLTVVALAYVLWPLDLIPIFVPVLGVLDDAAVVLLAGWLLTRAAPAVVRQFHRRRVGLHRQGDTPAPQQGPPTGMSNPQD